MKKKNSVISSRPRARRAVHLLTEKQEKEQHYFDGNCFFASCRYWHIEQKTFYRKKKKRRKEDSGKVSKKERQERSIGGCETA